MKYHKHLVNLLKQNSAASFFFVGLSLFLLTFGWYHDTFWKVLSYLFAIGCCFLISEGFIFVKDIKLKEWKINQPKMEFSIIAIVQFIVIIMLIYWFVLLNGKTDNQFIKISLLVLRVAFGFPVFILIYFVGFRKYSLKDIGFKFTHWHIAVPIISIYGLIAYLVFPEDLQFISVYQENGISSFIMLGFLTAAIPEEITRNLMQSRLSVLSNSKSTGWIIASFVWALVHIPTFSANSNLLDASVGAIGILPIGLFWGYLNQRYKSIIPAILFHGTNLWGLQNIFLN